MQLGCVVSQDLSDYLGDEQTRTRIRDIIQHTKERFILYFQGDQILHSIENYELMMHSLYDQVQSLKQDPWFDFSVIFASQNPTLLDNLGNYIQVSVGDYKPCTGPSLTIPNLVTSNAKMLVMYNRGANGGTLDYLHSGHKVLISVSLLMLREHLTIGVTGESLLGGKKHKELLQCFSARCSRVAEFAQLFKPSVEAQLVELIEPAGPTKDGQYDILIVTEETSSAIEYINNLRKANNLTALESYVVRVLAGVDVVSSKLSSSQTREFILNHNCITEDQFAFIRSIWVSLSEELTPYHRNYFDLTIVPHYSQTQRHYHTLNHIHDMLSQFTNITGSITHKRIVLFAIFFHDIIYYPQSECNEEASVTMFEQYCAHSKPEVDHGEVKQFIMATKSHKVHQVDNDLAYFLDLDLSILGCDSQQYERYAQNIRREYAFYDDVSYNMGRTQILNTFLQWDRIYQTQELYQKLEVRARINIANELMRLK